MPDPVDSRGEGRDSPGLVEIAGPHRLAPELRLAALTIEAWAMLDVTSGARVIAAKPARGAPSDSYALWLSYGPPMAAVGIPAGLGPLLFAPETLAPGRWHHLAYTVDDGTKTQALYVNGLRVASGNVLNLPGYDGQPLLIGCDKIPASCAPSSRAASTRSPSTTVPWTTRKSRRSTMQDLPAKRPGRDSGAARAGGPMGGGRSGLESRPRGNRVRLTSSLDGGGTCHRHRSRDCGQVDGRCVIHPHLSAPSRKPVCDGMDPPRPLSNHDGVREDLGVKPGRHDQVVQLPPSS